MTRPFYITTPIYYVNAKPHLGHAYTTIVADVATRFAAMQGRKAFFLTGTDEHGDKVVQAAEKQGVSVHEYVDEISGLFRSMWPELNCAYSRFIRTTQPEHKRVVTAILQKIYDQGDIYFSEYEGKYCFGCERFYTDRELVDGKCPDHEIEPEIIKESNYFFRMSKYRDWLVEHIHENPDFIRPERYKNEVLAFLREPLDDLCISRPKTRLTWGIDLPFDDNYVTYVWFDALINYVSALGWPDGGDFATYWPAAQHIVAKDILKPHGIYWPTMLKAAGLPLYNHLNVHGYWNVDHSKMSKSLGNVVDPKELKALFGLDAFRFFLMRDMTFGLDSSFNTEAIITRINADLANDLGNLFSRVLAMTHKFFKGVVPAADPQVEAAKGLCLSADALSAVQGFEESMAVFGFNRGLEAVWTFVRRMNKYVDETAPWALAKDESTRKELETVMYNLLEGLRVVSGLVYPVMPETAEKMQVQLGRDPGADYHLLDALKAWGATAAGTKIPKGESLFPRIDPEKIAKAVKKPEKKETAPPAAEVPPIKPEITFDDWGKLDLRVAKVLKAEAIPKAKKLLKLEIDLGEKRTIVAGVAQSYKPEDLVGKSIIVLANLKPAKIMGVESNGMLLAASSDGGSVVLTPSGDAAPGSPIR